MLIITFKKIKQEDNVADYTYKVYVNKRLIASGKVKNFDRAKGWKKLLEQIPEKTEGESFFEEWEKVIKNLIIEERG